MSRFQYKRRLARQGKLARKSVSVTQRQRFQDAVIDYAVSWLEQIDARHIALYLSVADELPTRKFARALLNKNYVVYAPRIARSSPQMELYPFTDLDQLPTDDEWDIPQPLPTVAPAKVAELDVVFLPVVGFTNKGDRIGQGRGYYDRYLGNLPPNPTNRKVRLVGLAYSAQKVKRFSVEAHDVCLDGVLTELGWQACNPLANKIICPT